MDGRLGPLVVGMVCIAAFVAAAGAVGAPQLDGSVGYDVTVPAGELVTAPGPGDETASEPDTFETYGLDVAVGGQVGWLSAAWGVGLLAAWVLVALRTSNASGVLLAAAALGLLLAAGLFVGIGGTRPEAPAMGSGTAGPLAQLVFLLLGVVTVLSGLALFLPDEADAYSAGATFAGARAGLIDLRRWLAGRSLGADAGETPPPDNDVYRAWAAVADRYGGPAQTPGEVVEGAAAAGVPPEPVRALRTVFEDVRYGGATPSADRVERARRARERVLDGVDDETGGADEGAATDAVSDTDEKRATDEGPDGAGGGDPGR